MPVHVHGNAEIIVSLNCRFAHLINVEFFQDLFNVMTELIESDVSDTIPILG